MPYIPLAIPPGFSGTDTDCKARAAGVTATLSAGAMASCAPVGGWEERVQVSTDAPRAAIAWADSDGDQRFAIGTATKLWTISASNTVTDITPAGSRPGSEDAASILGMVPEITVRGSTVRRDRTRATIRRLTLGPSIPGVSISWAVLTSDGRIYEWQLNVASDAAVVTNAPTGNAAIVVTDERFLFALGAGGNVRKVQWCDRENNTSWTPSPRTKPGT